MLPKIRYMKLSDSGCLAEGSISGSTGSKKIQTLVLVWAFESPKLITNDTLPPPRPYFLILSKSITP